METVKDTALELCAALIMSNINKLTIVLSEKSEQELRLIIKKTVCHLYLTSYDKGFKAGSSMNDKINKI